MSRKYPYYKGGVCLLLGKEEIFNEKTDRYEFSKYEICLRFGALPLDGCTVCKVYEGLDKDEIESRLSKKPDDL